MRTAFKTHGEEKVLSVLPARLQAQTADDALAQINIDMNRAVFGGIYNAIKKLDH